eukprot:scaffold12694_cov141-Skeletonema_marinoi.AAC.1
MTSASLVILYNAGLNIFYRDAADDDIDADDTEMKRDLTPNGVPVWHDHFPSSGSSPQRYRSNYTTEMMTTHTSLLGNAATAALVSFTSCVTKTESH